MARRQAPEVRLALLRAQREQVQDGDRLNAREMSLALGMTWRNLKGNLIDHDPGFPIEQRGAEGLEWSFDPARVLDYLIAIAAAEVAESDMRSARLARLTGATTQIDVAPVIERLSPEQLRVAAQTLVQVQKIKREQGQYVSAEAAREFLDGYHLHFQQEALGLLSRIDPAGQLSPALRTAVENDMRNLLVDLQGRMEVWIRESRASRPSPA